MTAHGGVRRGVRAPLAGGNRCDEDRRCASSSACKIDPSTRVCESETADSRESRSSACSRCASNEPSAEMYAEFFLVAKGALGDAALRIRRLVENAVKACVAGCARISRHGRNAQFAGVSTIRSDRIARSLLRRARGRGAAAAAPRRSVLRCAQGRRIHVSLIRKLFFSSCCSNRNAVPTIRVGTDATPPAQLG